MKLYHSQMIQLLMRTREAMREVHATATRLEQTGQWQASADFDWIFDHLFRYLRAIKYSASTLETDPFAEEELQVHMNSLARFLDALSAAPTDVASLRRLVSTRRLSRRVLAYR